MMTQRLSLVVAAGLMLFLFAASLALAGSFNYFNSYMGAFGWANVGTSQARQYNKVWRPIGYTFRAGYTLTGYSADNTWSNPFEIGASLYADDAFCENRTGSFVSPVTCQTTTP